MGGAKSGSFYDGHDSAKRLRHRRWRPKWRPGGPEPHEASTFQAKENFISTTQQQGSRNVGGKRPHNQAVYNAMESVEYLTPDTQREEHFFRTMSTNMRKFRGTTLWVLYAAIGVVVA